MNFQKYVNTYPYPSKADFTTTYYYHTGQLVAVSTVSNLDHKIPEIALKDCTKETVINRELFSLEQARYHENSIYLKQQFKADLADELGLTGHAKFDKLFEMAWCNNVAEGYKAVYETASELAELLY